VPAPGGEGVTRKDLIEAEEGVEGLGFVGGIDGNHAERKPGVGVSQVGHELDEEFVLAGLAGKDDYDGVAELVVDGCEQAGKGGDLIGAQMETGGAVDEGGNPREDGAEGVGVGWHGSYQFSVVKNYFLQPIKENGKSRYYQRLLPDIL